ncbi:DUF3533 domain-containing protein [Antrihabitans spumae]|uniref:DUF3533 domain-containing protein n=1 Tax=Antrihabitans spumae TaxID=3373370 RepID=A0ABW7K0E1_9NOCA
MTSDDSSVKAATIASIRNPRVWLAPVVVVGLVMSLLAVLYLDSILDPQKNLHDFPIAVVNQDEGENVVAPDGTTQRQTFGDQIVQGLVDGIPKDKVDLRQVGIAEEQTLLRKGEIYGSIVIPSDFSKRLLILAQASVVDGDVEKPVITVKTNPRAGTFAISIATTIYDQAMEQVNTTVGKQLTEQVIAQLNAGPTPTPISGASRLVLAEPIQIETAQYNPLPAGSGNGLAAFYYALLLLLAGFTGAMIVSSLVDAQLGFAPAEFGPWYIYNPSVHVSRFHTLVVKWVIMIVVGIVVSGLYLGISTFLDMPVTRPATLFAYGAFAIAAVGITATSIMAAFGTAGLVINLILFIILGVPSSGGTVPLEGQPPFFAWLANFEPLHQVFIGVRAILYYDARYDSGLLHAFWMTVFGLITGLVVGTVATRVYDRKGFHRKADDVTA